MAIRDGGVLATGFDAELDELRGLAADGGDFLLQLETRERERTGISNLRVEFNRVHGFYIEVTKGQTAKVPEDYRRRQTLKNAERYITPELKTWEDKVLSAQDRSLAREKWLFEQLLDVLAEHVRPLSDCARRWPNWTRWPRWPSTRAATTGWRPSCPSRPTSISTRAAILWSRTPSNASRPTAAGWTRRAACCSSPAPTWAVNRPICDRSR